MRRVVVVPASPGLGAVRSAGAGTGRAVAGSGGRTAVGGAVSGRGSTAAVAGVGSALTAAAAGAASTFGGTGAGAGAGSAAAEGVTTAGGVVVAMVGGDSGSVARVGLVSVAHRGVLMLDEAPEFDAGVLDALRQPMESGEVTVSRAGFAVTLPARFQLVLAANPCPCGRALDLSGPGHDPCTCTPHQKRRYLGRISGPLLDRVDLRLVLERPTAADLAFGHTHAEPTVVVAARVAAARERATARLVGTPWRTNGDVPGPELRRRFPPDPEAGPVLDRLVAGREESARGVDRVVRLAWTIADLAGHDRPGQADVLQALGLRSSEGRWAA